MNNNSQIFDFYYDHPFNITYSPFEVVDIIKKTNPISDYFKEYESLFTENTSVLELGCGIGWLSNSINYYKKSDITGIDLNPKVIAFAKDTALLMNLSSKFKVGNFLTLNEGNFDIVLSIGALHHSDNWEEAVAKAISHAKDSGYAIIGLYNKYAREPILDYFQKFKDKNYTKEQLFNEYKKIDNRFTGALLESWFYDQVLNPNEKLVTFKELESVFSENNFQIVATSLNNYQPFADIKDIYDAEMKFRDKVVTSLKNKKFYSGLFVVIAKKNA